MAISNLRAGHIAELVKVAVGRGHTTYDEVLRAVFGLLAVPGQSVGGPPVSDVASLLAGLIVSVSAETNPAHYDVGRHDPYVTSTRGVHIHALYAAPSDVGTPTAGPVPAHILAALQSRTAPQRPRRKGLRAEVIKGVEHDASGGISTHAPYVTIMDKGGEPLPAQFQQNEATPEAPAVGLWRHGSLWVARPALTGTYGPSGAHVTRRDGQLGWLGGTSPIALHDKPEPRPMRRFGSPSSR